MLDLNTKFYLHGIEIYRDYDDPTVFSYMPVLPHIPDGRNGPEFNLWAYRKTGEGTETQAGGFLTMTTSCDPGDVLDRVLEDLHEQFGDEARLVPVSFNSGTAELISIKATEKGATDSEAENPDEIVFIEHLEASQTPMLSGQYQAFFSATLSEDGVAFIEGILAEAGGKNPFGVRYDLKFTGLMPVQDLVIEIDYQRSYDYLRRRIGLSSVVLDVDMDSIVEDLKTNESIKITDLVRSLDLSTPEAVEARQKQVDDLVKELALGNMFTPTLRVGDPTVDENDTFGSELPPVSTLSDAVRRAGVAGAAAQSLAMAHRHAAAPQQAGAASDTPVTPPETPTPERPAAPQAKASFVMRSLSQSERRTVRYDLSRVTAVERPLIRTSGLSFMASPRELKGLVTSISLNSDFFKRFDINVSAKTMDFAAEDVQQLIVDLRYGQEADGDVQDQRSVVLEDSETQLDFTFFRDDAQTDFYEYRITAIFKPDTALGRDDLQVIGPWIKSDARSLVVHSDMVARTSDLSIRLEDPVPDTVERVTVKLEYREDGIVLDNSQIILDGNSVVSAIKTRQTAPDAVLSATALVEMTDGTDVTHDLIAINPMPVGTLPTSLTVPMPETEVFTFDVMFLDALQSIKSVIFDYELAQNSDIFARDSLELETAQARTVVSKTLPLPDDPVSLRFRERRVLKSGGVSQGRWVQSGGRSVMVGIPAADTRTVTVRYVGPEFAAMNIAGILVELSYSARDNDPDFEQTESLFLEGKDAQSWKFRLSEADHKDVTYTIQIFKTDGPSTPSSPAITNGEQLIIQPRI